MTTSARATARRIGSSIPSALLFSAFFIAVILSLLGIQGFLKRQEMRSTSVQAAAQIASQVGVLRAQNRQANSETLYNDVMESGSVAANHIMQMGHKRFIVLPAWGVIDIYNDPSSSGYVVSVAYAFANDTTRAMCQYMANGPIGQFRSVGPLGTDYAIGTRECSNPTYPLFTAVFQQ